MFTYVDSWKRYKYILTDSARAGGWDAISYDRIGEVESW